MSKSDVATSNLFGLERYLFCLKCFSSSRSCLLVKAVLGLRDFAPPIAPKYKIEKMNKLELGLKH